MFVYWSENLHLNFPTDISAGAGRSAGMMNAHLGLCWDGFQEQARWLHHPGLAAKYCLESRVRQGPGIRDGEMRCEQS